MTFKAVDRVKYFRFHSNNFSPTNMPLSHTYTIELEEWDAIRGFIADKGNHLFHHEKKESAIIGFDLSKYHRFELDGRVFYLIATNVFTQVIENVLPEATRRYPESFGKQNAYQVIDAIYKVERVGDFDYYVGFLSRENFAWVIEIVNSKPIDRILRLDLYRDIRDNAETGKSGFVGGMLHAYKHFSFNGIPLSTGTDNNALASPFSLVPEIIRSFFINEVKKDEETAFDYISLLPLNDGYSLKLVFYYEENSGVYFLRTAIKGRF